MLYDDAEGMVYKTLNTVHGLSHEMQHRQVITIFRI